VSILLVENDPALRSLLEVIIHRIGLKTETVAHGDMAWEAIRSGRHQAIVLDLAVPPSSGLEILRRLRDDQPQLLNRTVLLTALPAGAQGDFEFESLIWQLLRKPFDIQDFVDCLIDCIAFHLPRIPPSREELSRWMAERGAAIGSKAGVIAVTVDGALHLRADFGYGPGVADAVFPLPVGGNYPVCVAVRTCTAVFLASVTQAATQYPLLLPIWTANRSQSLAALPLRRAKFAIGAIDWSFEHPQAFDDGQRKLCLQAASECFIMLGAQEIVAHRRASTA
jgi:CheY-like chemotaxis protein